MCDEISHLLVWLIAAPLLQALERHRNNLPNKPNRLSVDIGPHKFTARQMEVAKLIALGLSNPEISRELSITPKTVENHLTQIYAQTKANNRVTLAQALSLMLHTMQQDRLRPFRKPTTVFLKPSAFCQRVRMFKHNDFLIPSMHDKNRGKNSP